MFLYWDLAKDCKWDGKIGDGTANDETLITFEKIPESIIEFKNAEEYSWKIADWSGLQFSYIRFKIFNRFVQFLSLDGGNFELDMGPQVTKVKQDDAVQMKIESGSPSKITIMDSLAFQEPESWRFAVSTHGYFNLYSNIPTPNVILFQVQFDRFIVHKNFMVDGDSDFGNPVGIHGSLTASGDVYLPNLPLGLGAFVVSAFDGKLHSLGAKSEFSPTILNQKNKEMSQTLLKMEERLKTVETELFGLSRKRSKVI